MSQTLDRNALQALRPLDVAAYLRAHGWREARHIGRASVWLTDGEGEEFEVLLPLTSTPADYFLRLNDLLQTLAVREHRSAVQVWRDLTAVNRDVLTVQVERPDRVEGSLSVSDGVRLARGLEGLVSLPFEEMRNAGPSPEWRMKSVCDGAFGMSLSTTVPPELGNGTNGATREGPPRREQLLALARALHGLQAAAQRASGSGKPESFRSALEDPRSADLCRVIGELVGPDDQPLALVFTFTWSPLRSTPEDAPTQVRLSADLLSLIGEGPRHLASHQREAGTTLRGLVVSLARKEGAEGGTVRVRALVKGRARTVAVELGRQQYEQAVRAHLAGTPVVCVGDLVHRGKRLVLEPTGELAVEAGS